MAAAAFDLLKGVQDKVSSVVPGGLPGGLTGVSTVSSIKDQGQSTLKKIFTEGITIPWIALLVLAGAIPFPPFNYWGFGGVNLIAAGSKSWAAAKAAVSAACTVAGKYMKLYYPSLWPIRMLIEANPWYIFDLIQLFSPAFDVEGFKVPFIGTQVRPADGQYTVGGVAIGSALALFSLGGYNLLQSLPPQIVGAAKPTFEMIFKVIGGATVVGGGGLSAYVALPGIISSLKGDAKEIRENLAPGPAATPPASGASSVAAPPASGAQQVGGGGTGGSIPSLHEIADGILGSMRDTPAPYRSGILTGGASGSSTASSPDIGSSIFLGTLAVAALGGISLALVRSKTASQ